MSGVELATAWVRLVPSVEGITDNITKAFAPGVAEAGKAGDASGGLWSSKVKGAIGAAAIAAGVVAAFKGLYEVGAIFDDVSDTIRVGTGATGEDLKALEQAAKNVGTTVPAEFSKIGPTIADLNTRLGLTGPVLEKVASQYLEAGRILGQEVDINSTTAAFSAFKIEGEAVSGAMDTLFQVSQATGVGMNELASGVQTVAPALQTLGFSFTDSVALMGTLDKAGLNAEAILGSLSKGMVTLAKDGEQPAEAFQRVTGELQGFVAEGNTAAALDLASQVFGTKGAAQFVGALESGVLNMNDLMSATGATGDTILGVGGETMDFAEQWKVTMNNALVAIEPLATAVFAAIGDGLKAAMPFLKDMGKWVSENQDKFGIIAGVIGGVLVVGILAFTAAMAANTIVMLAYPITWIILAIVALIAIIVLLVMNWDQVVAWITDVWNGFIGWIKGVIDGFSSWWDGVWQGIVDFVKGVWEGISAFFASVWEGIKTFFSAAFQFLLDLFLNWTVYGLIIKNWDEIVAFFKTVWDSIVEGVKKGIQFVADTISNVINGIKSVWESVWNGISSFFSGIWDGIVGAVNKFGDTFRGIFEGIKGFVEAAFSGVLGAVKGPINGIIGLLNSAISSLNKISVDIPDWVPVVGGQKWGLSLPKIPALADGATVMPRSGGTLAILAEAGRPESVVDTGLMNRALKEGLGSSSGVTVKQYITTVQDDPTLQARQWAREAQRGMAAV